MVKLPDSAPPDKKFQYVPGPSLAGSLTPVFEVCASIQMYAFTPCVTTSPASYNVLLVNADFHAAPSFNFSQYVVFGGRCPFEFAVARYV